MNQVSLEEFIQKAEYTQNYYFWRSNNCASGRRSCEKNNSVKHESIIRLLRKTAKKSEIWEFKIVCSIEISQSCRNTYRVMKISINDNQSDLRVIKNLQKMIIENSSPALCFCKKFGILMLEE